jgi:hypothetical protein
VNDDEFEAALGDGEAAAYSEVFDHDVAGGASFTALPAWELHGPFDAFEGTTLGMVAVDGPKGMEFTIYVVTGWHPEDGHATMLMTCSASTMKAAVTYLKRAHVTEIKNSTLWPQRLTVAK